MYNVNIRISKSLDSICVMGSEVEMKVTDYNYVVFVEHICMNNRVTILRRGFQTLERALKYLREVNCSSFTLSAWIN